MELKAFGLAAVKRANPARGIRFGEVVVLLDRLEKDGRFVWLVERFNRDLKGFVACIPEEELEPDLEAWANRSADETDPADAERVAADSLADAVSEKLGIERPKRGPSTH